MKKQERIFDRHFVVLAVLVTSLALLDLWISLKVPAGDSQPLLPFTPQAIIAPTNVSRLWHQTWPL